MHQNQNICNEPREALLWFKMNSCTLFNSIDESQILFCLEFERDWSKYFDWLIRFNENVRTMNELNRILARKTFEISMVRGILLVLELFLNRALSYSARSEQFRNKHSSIRPHLRTQKMSSFKLVLWFYCINNAR